MRLVDANLDRGGEALRFLDDLARFTLNDENLSRRLRDIRHALGGFSARLTMDRLSARDVAADVGVEAPASGSPGLAALASANARRAAESLRSLEEAAKLPEMAGRLDSDALRRLRFQVYAIEKELVPRLARSGKAGGMHGTWLGIDCGRACGRHAREIVSQAVMGGLKAVAYQSRGKVTASDFELAGWLREATVDKVLMLTDSLELALATHADGYLLERGGLSVEAARRALSPDRLVVAAAVDAREAGILAGAGADALILESAIGLRVVKAVVKVVSCPVVVALGVDDTDHRAFGKADVAALLFSFRDPRVANAGAIARLGKESYRVSDGA
jgi:thiamine-phosphate pyrophosphorylase